MLDVLFVAVILALFGVTVLFVRACDRIIGSDEEALAGSTTEPSEPTRPTQPTEALRRLAA